ncbi:hypothetical protein AAMO2058_000054900 [Amorphochlora amoebiformis]
MELLPTKSSPQPHRQRKTEINNRVALTPLPNITSSVSIACCALSSDGSRVLIGCHGPDSSLWDVETQVKIATLTGHTSPVTSCSLTPKSSLALTVSDDIALIFRLTDIGTPLLSSSDESDLHASTETKCVCVSASVEVKCGIDGMEYGKMRSCHLSHDGTQALTLDDKGTLILWSVHLESGRTKKLQVVCCSRSQQGQQTANFPVLASSCCLSGDGSKILVGGGGVVRVCRVGDQQDKKGFVSLCGKKDVYEFKDVMLSHHGDFALVIGQSLVRVYENEKLKCCIDGGTQGSRAMLSGDGSTVMISDTVTTVHGEDIAIYELWDIRRTAIKMVETMIPGTGSYGTSSRGSTIIATYHSTCFIWRVTQSEQIEIAIQRDLRNLEMLYPSFLKAGWNWD